MDWSKTKMTQVRPLVIKRPGRKDRVFQCHFVHCGETPAEHIAELAKLSPDLGRVLVEAVHEYLDSKNDLP